MHGLGNDPFSPPSELQERSARSRYRPMMLGFAIMVVTSVIDGLAVGDHGRSRSTFADALTILSIPAGLVLYLLTARRSDATGVRKLGAYALAIVALAASLFVKLVIAILLEGGIA